MAQKFLTGVQLINGSAGSPALSFSSDTNTGIYRSAADTLNVSINGTSMLSVNSSGITSGVNVYSGTNGQFRNYAGVWKATTGTSGNGFEFTTADQTGAMTLSSTGYATFASGITAAGALLIQGGSSQIILKDTTDDDDHSIVFRNNLNVDDYIIRTRDFTSAATGDGLYIGSIGGDNVALVTNNVTALDIDISQNANFSGNVSSIVYYS